MDDTQETDWEILTTTTLQGSGTVDAGIWATNQAATGQPKTHELIPFDFDPSEDFHGTSLLFNAELKHGV